MWFGIIFFFSFKVRISNDDKTCIQYNKKVLKQFSNHNDFTIFNIHTIRTYTYIENGTTKWGVPRFRGDRTIITY